MATAAPQKPELPAPPPRCCIACTDTPDAKDLIQPCRVCETEYCRECLTSMFKAATTDNSRMPPHCCAFLQLHTAISGLTDQEASDYRAKFDEWVTLDKTYCPVPTCSAFISEKLLPSIGSPKAPPTLQSVLADVVKKISASPPARFFRGEMDITILPGYTDVIADPIDLPAIQARLDDGRYASTQSLTRDMELIVANAHEYNKLGHPVSNTADELLALYLKELSTVLDRAIAEVGGSAPQSIFACPKCHIAICAKCKQIEHSPSACDTTAEDQTLAMLEQYRYKRCPLCKHAVRKMFGCSHMLCVCGAHWCWRCQSGIQECEGGCGGDDESEEDEGDYDDADDDEADEENAREGHDASHEAGVTEHNKALLVLTETNANQSNDPANPPQTGQATPTTSTDRITRIRNLDAGGSILWAETGLDFGDEPSDEGYAQVWSCRHRFDLYYPKADNGNHGDESRMECTRCFRKVTPTPYARSAASKKNRVRGPTVSTPSIEPVQVPVIACVGGKTGERQALECDDCHLVVCADCRDRYEASRKDE